MRAEAAGAGRAAFGRVLDVLFPAQCLTCGTLVETPGALCAECWRAISFVTPPACAACGTPFPYHAGEGALCAACARRRPDFERARAVMLYDDASRGLILAFKHADRTDAAPALGAWLARAAPELLAEADLVVPVPLHWARLFQRRYNQSALLARAVGRAAAKPVLADALIRHKRTPPLGRASPSARRRILAGAFAVPARHRARVTDKRVLLVDDVLTTGATAEACARALKRAGAAAVDVLTLARVVRAAD